MLKRVVFITLLISALITTTVLAASQDVTILHTNETLGVVETNEDMNELGLMKLATLVDNLREDSNLILLDGGNALAGSYVADRFKGEGIARMMDSIGYDALLAGSGEIKYGYYQLLRLNQLSKFPIISANMRKDGQLILPPYTIIEKAGVKVGVLGLTSPNIEFKNKIKGLKILDPVQVAKNYLPKLKEKVDIIIALTNLEKNKLNEELNDFDLILYKDNRLKRTTAANKINLIFENDQIKKSNFSLVESKDYINGDKKLANKYRIQFLHKFHSNAKYVNLIDRKKLDLVVEKLNRNISTNLNEEEVLIKENKKNINNSKRSKDNIKDSKVKTNEDLKEKIYNKEIDVRRVIADSIAYELNTNLALVSSNRIKLSQKQGEVVINLPKEQRIIVKRISGARLRECLERAVTLTLDGSNEFLQINEFLQVAGIEFKFDENKPAGEKVIYVLANGKELNDEKQYEVAFNSAVLNKDSRYLSVLSHPPTVDAKKVSLKKIIENYIEVSKNKKQGLQVTGRIKRIRFKDNIKAKHVVKKYDTLWSIAQKYDLSVDKLRRFNQMSNNLIILGQTIYIPEN